MQERKEAQIHRSYLEKTFFIEGDEISGNGRRKRRIKSLGISVPKPILIKKGKRKSMKKEKELSVCTSKN